jgi:hypothetical protein
VVTGSGGRGGIVSPVRCACDDLNELSETKTTCQTCGFFICVSFVTKR